MTPQIREVDSGDAASIHAAVRVLRAAYRPEAEMLGLTAQICASHPAFVTAKWLETILASKRVHLFGLYSQDGGMVGLLLMRYLPNRICETIRLCVIPEMQGRGYGYSLLAFVQDQARRHDCATLTIRITRDNPVLLAWCQRQGFQIKFTLRFPGLPYVLGYLEKEMHYD